MSLIFGHHPFDAGYFAGTDTGLTEGRDALLALIDSYGVSMYGNHTIEVRAIGSSTRSDTIVTDVNPARCLGDQDGDSDVDGADLHDFMNDFVQEVIVDVAAAFGRADCR